MFIQKFKHCFDTFYIFTLWHHIPHNAVIPALHIAGKIRPRKISNMINDAIIMPIICTVPCALIRTQINLDIQIYKKLRNTYVIFSQRAHNLVLYGAPLKTFLPKSNRCFLGYGAAKGKDEPDRGRCRRPYPLRNPELFPSLPDPYICRNILLSFPHCLHGLFPLRAQAQARSKRCHVCNPIP